MGDSDGNEDMVMELEMTVVMKLMVVVVVVVLGPCHLLQTVPNNLDLSAQ